MALTPNILLHLSNKISKTSEILNLKDFGIISLEFERVGQPTEITGVLQNVVLTFFDPTGYTILSYLQKTKNTLYLQYGYEDNLSNIIELTVVKINTSFAKGGILVALGAVGTATSAYSRDNKEIIRRGTPLYPNTTRSASYTTDPTNIYDNIEHNKLHKIGLLKYIADRNNWETVYNGKQLINLGKNSNIYIPYDIINRERNDQLFITNEIVPIANKTVLDKTLNYADLYYAQWFEEDNKIYFTFQPKDDTIRNIKVWNYDYGVSEESKIISMTNKLDTTFLLQEIKIEVPVSVADLFKINESRENEVVVYKEEFDAAALRVETQLKELGFSIPVTQLTWAPKYVLDRTLSSKDAEERAAVEIAKKVNQIISAFSTMELEVIGNPKISPLDYVSINAVNVDGNNLFVSSVSTKIFWRITKIRETINSIGYSTTLSLVRSIEDTVGSSRTKTIREVDYKLDQLGEEVNNIYNQIDNIDVDGGVHVGDTEPTKPVLWLDTSKE